MGFVAGDNLLRNELGLHSIAEAGELVTQCYHTSHGPHQELLQTSHGGSLNHMQTIENIVNFGFLVCIHFYTFLARN